MGKDPRAAIAKQIRQEMEWRTNRALKEKHKQFRIDHAKDTDEQLLDYLCVCAQDLGYSPAYGEVIGYSYIQERFGSWTFALRQAGLKVNYARREKSKKTKLYKNELAHQYKLRKVERVERCQQRIQQKKLQREKQQRILAEPQANETLV